MSIESEISQSPLTAVEAETVRLSEVLSGPESITEVIETKIEPLKANPEKITPYAPVLGKSEFVTPVSEKPAKRALVAVATLSLSTLVGCSAGSFFDDFGGRSLAALVNYTGISIFCSLATDNKKVRRVLGGIGAGIGLIFPWTMVFGVFLGTAGVVIKINDKDRNIGLAKEEKQAGEDAARALARYHGIRRMQGKE